MAHIGTMDPLAGPLFTIADFSVLRGPSMGRWKTASRPWPGVCRNRLVARRNRSSSSEACSRHRSTSLMRALPGSSASTDWANQLQLRGLPRTEIRSAAGANEQAQQEVAPAPQFPRAAIGEVEDHGVRNDSGFQRPDALLKSHRSPRAPPACAYRYVGSSSGAIPGSPRLPLSRSPAGSFGTGASNVDVHSINDLSALIDKLDGEYLRLTNLPEAGFDQHLIAL